MIGEQPLLTIENRVGAFFLIRWSMLALVLSAGMKVTGLSAATLTVTTLDDEPGAVGCSLRLALESVNSGADTGGCNADGAYGEDDRIHFHRDLEGTLLLEQGPMQITSPVIIDAARPSRIVIDANQGIGILDIHPDAESVLRDLTFTGNVHSGTSTNHQRNPIRSRSHLTLERVQIIDNSTAGWHGGAVSVQLADLVVRDSLIANNSALQGEFACPTTEPLESQCVAGGGIAVFGGDALIERSRIENNYVQSANPRGGGVFVMWGNLTVIESQVLDNQAEDIPVNPNNWSPSGGGIHVSGTTSTGNVQLIDAMVAGNEVLNSGHGGGVAVRIGELFSVDSQIENNLADGQFARGGGIHLVDSPGQLVDTRVMNNVVSFGAGGGGIVARRDLELVRSTVANNLVFGDGYGGGILAHRHVSIVNSTISGNELLAGGGAGIALRYDNQIPSVERSLSILHSTLAGNQIQNSDDGPGILYVEVDEDLLPFEVEIEHSILVQTENQWGQLPPICSSVTISGTLNLATDTSCGSSILIGEQPIAAEALELGPLDLNQSVTPVHPLGPTSLAIDAAGDCLASQGLGEDQRGLARPGGASALCDVGAYEYQEVSDQIFADRFQGN